MDKGYDRENNISVMPLRSDGSLCLGDAFEGDWRYENEMGANNPNEEGAPKLEDFLGCYSISSHEETKIHCQNQTHVPKKNVDAGSFSRDREMGNHINPETLVVPSSHIQNSGVSLFDSISGFTSHLRQTQLEKASGEPNSRNFQTLTLTTTPSSQSTTGISAVSSLRSGDNRKRSVGKSACREVTPRKSIDTFGQRTSQYRGVTRHRWTGRYEAHLWDNSCRKEGQTRKGRQVYLGGYDKEEKAARAYDLAALKYWGPTTHINFPLSTYERELEEMKNISRQEFVANLRRKSSGFSRGASVYRGVTRHHQHGRWQARIGRVAGNKDLYLGTFSTQEEAAEAYDIAAIKFRGTSAVTNFNISRYDVTRICSSSTLIASDLAKRSPRDLSAASMEDSSTSSPQPHLSITNGDPSDELTDMGWTGGTIVHYQQHDRGNCEFGTVGDYSQEYLSLQDSSFEDHGNNGNGNAGSGDDDRQRNLGFVHHHAPMFALWNE